MEDRCSVCDMKAQGLMYMFTLLSCTPSNAVFNAQLAVLHTKHSSSSHTRHCMGTLCNTPGSESNHIKDHSVKINLTSRLRTGTLLLLRLYCSR